MQNRMNDHERDTIKLTRTLAAQIEEKDLKIAQYKLLLKTKKEHTSEEQKKIKDNFETAKKTEDK